jgi:hypothetical protein
LLLLRERDVSRDFEMKFGLGIRAEDAQVGVVTVVVGFTGCVVVGGVV